MATRRTTAQVLPFLVVGLALPSAAEPERAERLQLLANEVSAVERDFAATMARRDVEAFARFVAEDAVFRRGGELLIGRSAVVEGWRTHFKPGQAPFSWEPDRVTVAASGVTAVSSGPVRDSGGRLIGRFTTVWHRDVAPDGSARWRAIVDQGVPLVECGETKR